MITAVLSTNFQKSHGQGRPYIEYFRKFGEVILVPPLDIGADFTTLMDVIGLWVLPGGKDINPARYNARPNIWTGLQDPSLEHFDTKILLLLIEAGKPIFGICRGMQALNVHFGGNLIQDMAHGFSSESRDELVHWVYGGKNRHKQAFKVNSLHHQAINVLGSNLEPLLWASVNKPSRTTVPGVVEAFRHTHYPIAGVEWHPEELFNATYTDGLIRSLL